MILSTGKPSAVAMSLTANGLPGSVAEQVEDRQHGQVGAGSALREPPQLLHRPFPGGVCVGRSWAPGRPDRPLLAIEVFDQTDDVVDVLRRHGEVHEVSASRQRFTCWAHNPVRSRARQRSTAR